MKSIGGNWYGQNKTNYWAAASGRNTKPVKVWRASALEKATLFIGITAAVSLTHASH